MSSVKQQTINNKQQTKNKEAIMAQAINFDTIATPSALDKKAYAVNIKGLIAHAVDILFGGSEAPKQYNVSDLPVHLQKDIGMYR